MRYINIGGEVIPKHCIYGPRPAEGIVFSNVEWWSITDHLVKEERERELAAVQRAKEEAKKNTSYEMTRQWNNTLASIKTQGNQKRKEKMERERQEKIEQYNEIMKNREAQKKELMANLEKTLFEQTDAAKTVTSAVGYSLALDECRKQIEWKNSVRKEEARKEKEFGEELKKLAEEFARDQLYGRIKEKEKKAIQKKYLDDQMEDIKRRRKLEEEEFEEEKQDLINMQIEAEKVHHCNMIEQNYRKKFAAKYMRKTQTQIEFERKLALEQEEEDEINKIFMEYDRKFKKERKQREEKIKNEAIEKRIKVAEKLAEQLRDAAMKEEERLQAAADEKEKDALMQEQRKKELADLALKSILDGKRKSEQRKAKLVYNRKEEKKWEMMQQYRSAEIYNEWKEADWKSKKDLQRKVRATYDCQVKEMRERQAKELAELMQPLESEAADREKFLKFSQEALDFVRERNLPEFPVLNTIARLKKTLKIEEENTKKGQQGQQGQEQTGQQDNRKCNPRSSITGLFCFKT